MKCLNTLKINIWFTEDILFEKLPDLQTFFFFFLILEVLDQNESKYCDNLEVVLALCQIAS